MKIRHLFLAGTLLFFLYPTIVFGFWRFPPLPPPYQYGNILINRTSEANKVKPVFFSHWSHRIKYSCSVCHLDLEFEFAKNSTVITEQDNVNGLFCGACHNGKEVFGHTKEHCDKCHSGSISSGLEKFEKITATWPKTFYGNQVDWVLAVSEGKIKPQFSLNKKNSREPLNFQENLELKAEWTYVPPAFFPHKAHTQILDCANCHQDIFNIKKKTTPHFEMKYILEKKFCGVCHLNVAFPLNDCKRCHPGIQNQ